MELNCQVCGKTFAQTNKYRASKTCSRECRYQLSAKSTRETSGALILATCQGCGGEFETRTAKPTKFCSRECFDQSRAEASRVSRTCVQCGEEFSAFKRTDQTYCSPTCRNRHLAAQREHNYPRCRACGESTESHNRVYCPEHTVKGGPKLKPRLEAVCVGCGEPFSRPAGYSGKLKYCSNKCSHREVKSVRDKFILDLNDKAIVFHSMWEVRFVAACERFDIPWRRYDGPDIATPAGTYRPDFIIHDDTVVEVKGWLRPESAVKIDGTTVLFINKDALLAFERDGSFPCAQDADALE
jgi:hypothetical protein